MAFSLAGVRFCKLYALHFHHQHCALAVRGEEQEEQVAARVHDLAQMPQHPLEVLRGGERDLADRARMIDEGHGPAPGAEPLVEQVAHGHHLALEDSLWSVARKTYEIELGGSGG